MAKKTNRSLLNGDVSLLLPGKQSFASAQIELLQAVAQCGSISKAAQRVGISYKTAWDRINAMNNMANQPLVIRTAGGAKGGGSEVTEFGEQIIAGFQALQQQHQHFIQQLGQQLHDFADIADFMHSESRQTSARNQFRGKVSKVIPGAVNAEVTIDIGAKQTLVAIITQDSVASLGLKKNASVIALVKASSVIVSAQNQLATSARNHLCGNISRIVTGAVNSDISIDLPGGKSVAAIITNHSVDELQLREGQPASALFKASSVILMKDA